VSGVLRPLDVGPARADRDVVVGDAVEQTDRLARCLVVVAVLDVARRVEPNVGGKVSALRCIHLAKTLTARINRGYRAFGEAHDGDALGVNARMLGEERE